MIKNRYFIIFLYTISFTQSIHLNTATESAPVNIYSEYSYDPNHKTERSDEKINTSTNFTHQKPKVPEYIKQTTTEQQKEIITQTQQNAAFQQIKSQAPSNNIQDIFLPENKDSFINLNNELEMTGLQQNKTIQQIFDPLTTSQSLNINNIIKLPNKIAEVFDIYMNETTVFILQKSLHISPNAPAFQTTFAEIITNIIRRYLFELQHLPENLNTSTNIGNSLNNFKMEIQFLSQQINFYNGKKFYTNPEQMLTLIKIINKFLKSTAPQNSSFNLSKKLDTIQQLATQCCNLFENQNIIFSTEETPSQILSFFQQPISKISDKTSLQLSYNLFDNLYNPQGVMDQTIQSWQKFQKSNLYKNKINRQYGAFITFLLLFENSIIAAAIILDQTSELYKVTNPIPVIINFNGNSTN